MTATTEASAYPISAATRRELERPLFGHFIDGEVVESLEGGTMPVIDPATGEEVATAAAGTAADVDRAARSARAAFEDGRWRFLAPLEKERRLRRLATLLSERADVFIELDVIDCGFLRAVAFYINQFAVEGIEYYAGWPSKLRGSIPAVPHELAVYEVKEPIGVVGAIIPWNGPSAGASMAVFALCAGNSVVLKPAEQTPMTAVLLAELALEAGIPPGVFNVVQGTGETVGAALVEHPQVDSIFFTGSVATGMAIQAAAAKHVKRVGLELGGKSPLIIFPDADLEAGGRHGDGWRVGRVWPVLHVRDARHGPQQGSRRTRERGRRKLERPQDRRRVRSRRADRPADHRAAARARPRLCLDRPRRRRPSWPWAASSPANAASSISRPCSPTFATTCGSRRRRSSVP